MASLAKKLSTISTNRTTYRLGMIQTRAYRTLMHHTTVALKPYEITPPEWAMLGILYDLPHGVRFSTIAEEVGVEPPFVTVMAKKLMTLGYAAQKEDPTDNRAKLITITTVGKKMVPRIETHVRQAMRPFVDGISPQDLLAYFSTIHHFAHTDGSTKK